MIETRDKIETCLAAAGIGKIIYKKGELPAISDLPAAIVILSSGRGKHKIKGRYLRSEISFEVYLISDALVEDPDVASWNLIEAVRAEYIFQMKDDIDTVEFYGAKLKNTHPVMIAKFVTGTE